MRMLKQRKRKEERKKERRYYVQVNGKRRDEEIFKEVLTNILSSIVKFLFYCIKEYKNEVLRYGENQIRNTNCWRTRRSRN